MTGQHRDFLPIQLGVCGLVTVVGFVNDEAIAAISPKHFDVFYPAYFPVTSPWLQALCFALVIAGGCGFAWASLLYWVGHYGPGPIVGTKATVIGATTVVALSIIVAWGLGWRTWVTGVPPYKDFFYPSTDPRLYFSQTVQLTNEVLGLAGAGLWMVAIAVWRWWRSEDVGKSS